MSRIGYIRVSTEHQETARQQEIMCDYQVDRIFSEKISGANKDRPQLKAMLDYVREGDTLYIESISRLGRSTKDLLNIIDTLTDKGVTLVSHKENIDTDTPTGKFMLTVFAAHSLSLKENSSNSDSVRASRSPKHRASTQAESPLRSTGRGSGSSMGNGSPKASRGVTLCGEWACQLTLFTAVSGSMKQNMGQPSRPLLDSPLRRTETPLRAVRACGAEN